MNKYRIKILTYKNGISEYMPQEKSFLSWKDMIGWPLSTHQKAKEIIDNRIKFSIKK